MRINKLQINDFGKFCNKEIELENNINIIKGNNESGKSTIQKFIVSMLYGISKDKRKSSFTDYDKYYPWGKESFSGKINYTLDNGQTYEVFRDFTKKMPTLYNENAEDITKHYSSTKSKGSNFFEEQTGVDEKTMTSSMVTEQANVVIDQSSENFMIQKIANMAETGDERISYDKALTYLTKKRNEEVGTDKTKNRPINILNDEKRSLKYEQDELQKYNNEQFEIDDIINDLKEEHNKNQELLEFAHEYKALLDDETETKNKVLFYKESINANEKKKKEFYEQKNTIEMSLEKAKKEYNDTIEQQKKAEIEKEHRINKLNEDNKRRSIIFMVISILSLIASIVTFTIKLMPIGTALLIGMIAILLFSSISNKKNKQKVEKYMHYEENTNTEEQTEYIRQIESELKELNLKIELLSNSNNESNKQIKELNNYLKNYEEEKVKELINKYKEIDEHSYSEIIGSNKITSKIKTLQDISNNNKLEIQKYEYKKNQIMSKLERLAEIQEQLNSLNEREQELIDQADAISLASEVLEEAYEEMKKNVVPKFTENLSETISNISNGKYTKVITNDKDGLLVEKENGEYVPAKALSIGTIDQLYLSLRFAITSEATQQKMPLILDEAFPFYDNERLEKILKYISKQFSENQVIIFTCSSREVDILNKENINYNLIEL